MKSKHRKAPAILPEDLMHALLEAGAPIGPEPERATRLRQRLLRQVRASKHAGLKTVLKGQGRWIKLGPLVDIKLLRSDEQSRSYLLRMQPGAVLPPHQHALDEECLMLEGEVWIGDIHLCAGDYHVAAKGTPHGEVRTSTGGLAFLRGAHPEDRVAITNEHQTNGPAL
ncbi:MAG: cupin domain-containing protein [Gammaproteobacteria bacterium]